MKIKTLGKIRTAMGDYWVVPCGCDKELIPPQYNAVEHNFREGVYRKPHMVEFQTDYIFENIQAEIEVED